jgi:Ca-activated chloride channel family protein
MKIMRIKKFIFLLVLPAIFHSFVQAQQQQQDDEVIKVESAIVRLNVGVADRQGRPVTNLNKGNFTLFENGVKQEITNFATTVEPFSVVVLLDMSGSTLGFREVIRQSAARFVEALAPEDRVAVVEFYDKVNLLNDFTNKRKTIFDSINVANGRGKTELYKALDFSLGKLAKEGKRRKAIIVLSDGADTTARADDRRILEKVKDSEQSGALKPESNDALARVLNKADVQGTTIYPLALPTGDPAKLAEPTTMQTAMYRASRARLEILASRTGGTFNAINRLEDMGRIYASVAADLRALYTIEYSPADTKRDGAWRAIKIEVDNSELISRTRPGYFSR